jgi:hypothetical protein
MKSCQIGCDGTAYLLLALGLVVLKALNLIDWSWVWVLAPLWIPLAGGLLLCMIWGSIIFLATALK